MKTYLKCCGVILNMPITAKVSCCGICDKIEVPDDFVLPGSTPKPRPNATCPHLGPKTGRVIRLKGCRHGGRRLVAIHQCDLHKCEVAEYKVSGGPSRSCQVCKYQGEN